ncbi:YibE/F family protein [Caloranaerobacter azorensis]|uniref:YibE/F family protein n=1 Tax=Caloranaerobacter azorensis TaxID=116090 RepID=UPI0005509C34|nr:YibE/F family protein [Caloranaerobacter azorensis]
MSIYDSRRLFFIVVLLTVFILIFNVSSVFAEGNDGDFENEMQDISQEELKPVHGKVVEILSDEIEETEGYDQNYEMRHQRVKVKITSGKHKGETIIVDNYIDERIVYNIIVNKGDNVLLFLEEDENGNILVGYIGEIARDKYLLYLVIVFILLLILVGGFKGFKTVITLALTILAVVKILLPLILKGYSPVLVSIIVSIGVIIITLLIISGINKKTLCAIIGTAGGVLIAGSIALGIGTMAKLTGLGNEEAQMLMFIPQNISFNFRGLLFAGIILGALGAVMDVSMSISSAMYEMQSVNPEISTKDLIKSGMNMGRDIMGTMSNTLILAYAGGAIHLMLLFLAYNFSFVEIINRDMIASEVVRALAGSIGLILTIPLTVLVSGTIGRDKNYKSI